MRRGLMATLLACLAMPGAPALGQSTEPLLTETEYYGDMPSVLTATRLAQPALESPSSITVLTRERIAASGARDVAELLRLVPGFQVSYFLAHRPGVSYHGLADDFARRLQVLVDGRSVYTPLFGGALWSSLSVAVQDIERIEVIRSPNAASYGPNSFSAIINIITRHAASDAGNLVSATRGQAGRTDAFARANGSVGDAHYRLSLEHEEGSGFEGEHDGRNLQRLEARLDQPLGGGDTLTAKAGGTAADLEVGTDGADLQDSDTNVPRDLAVDTAFAQLEWTHMLGGNASVSVQYYANYDSWIDDNRYDQSDGFRFPPARSGQPSYPDPTVRVDLSAEARRHDLEVVYRARLSERTRVVAGTGARREELESRWLFGSNEEQVNRFFRLFGHVEHRVLDDTVLHAGALVEDNALVGTTASPRLALVQEIAPYHRLRFSASYATRTPTLLEQRQDRHFIVRSSGQPAFKFFTDYTNADLDPERMRALELGYRIDPPGRHWGMDVKIFSEEIQDVLVEVPTDPPGSPAPPGFPDPPPPLPSAPDQNDSATGFVNGFSARLEGIEGSLSVYPGSDLDLRLWASSVDVKDVRAVSEDVRERSTASLPRLTTGVQAIYRVAPRRTLSLDYYYNRMRGSDGRRHVRTDRLDLRYREEFGSTYPSGFVAVGIDSVLGEYVEYHEDNVVDTRVYLEGGLRF